MATDAPHKKVVMVKNRKRKADDTCTKSAKESKIDDAPATTGNIEVNSNISKTILSKIAFGSQASQSRSYQHEGDGDGIIITTHNTTAMEQQSNH